jgi:hypothetical protein
MSAERIKQIRGTHYPQTTYDLCDEVDRLRAANAALEARFARAWKCKRCGRAFEIASEFNAHDERADCEDLLAANAAIERKVGAFERERDEALAEQDRRTESLHIAVRLKLLAQGQLAEARAELDRLVVERWQLRLALLALRDGIDGDLMHCDAVPELSSWRFVIDKALAPTGHEAHRDPEAAIAQPCKCCGGRILPKSSGDDCLECGGSGFVGGCYQDRQDDSSPVPRA